MRKWFDFVVVVIALIVRYLPGLGRFGLSFRSGEVAWGVSMNRIGFWLVLAIGFVVEIVDLVKLIRVHGR